MIKRSLSILFICMCLFSQAQQIAASYEPQMADIFRQDGKIYVVIAVIALIFVSLIAFLVFIERKLKRIEDKMKELKS